MVSQSKDGFPLNGFSIKKWFPLNGFSIIKWFSQKMAKTYFLKNMFSQSLNGFPLNGISIKKWKTIYFSKKWFLNHYMAFH